MSFIILSDSSCDLPKEVADKLDIHIVPFYVSFDGENYLQETVDITPDDFYKLMQANKTNPKTSLPSTADYIEKFLPFLETEQDICCVCISTGLSGSYQSAINAKNMLAEKFPHRRIELVDSQLATSIQGLLVEELVAMKNAGYELDFCLSTINQLKHTAKTYFMVDSLDSLQRGGRISSVSAMAGTLLNIKPIILLKDGVLEQQGVVRGKKKALKTMMESAMEETAHNPDDYRFTVPYGASQTDANEYLAEYIQQYKLEDIKIGQAGITIGSHTGPTALGVAYIKKYQTMI